MSEYKFININGDLPQVFVAEGKNYKFEIPV